MMANKLLAIYAMVMNHNKPISTRDTEIGYKGEKRYLTSDIFWTQCQASETGSHLNVTKSFLLLTSSLPNSDIALRVFNDPAAAQSYQESCTPPLCSGKQLPDRAEQIFIIKINFIDNPI